jgi:hypothetical protein
MTSHQLPNRGENVGKDGKTRNVLNIGKAAKPATEPEPDAGAGFDEEDLQQQDSDTRCAPWHATAACRCAPWNAFRPKTKPAILGAVSIF